MTCQTALNIQYCQASVSINLNKALIQPIIEYSAQVWSPFTKIQIESIEQIQRNFTRYAFHYLTIDYKERCGLRSCQNGSLFYPRNVRTKTFKSFYSNRVISIWNRLPTDLRQEQSLDGFVRKLNSFYYLKFQTSFNCGNVCSWTSICGCQACAWY